MQTDQHRQEGFITGNEYKFLEPDFCLWIDPCESVVLTFDFFARREELSKKKNPGTYVARLASTFFVYLV